MTRSRRAAFTLIELMLMLAIFAVMTSAAIVGVPGVIGQYADTGSDHNAEKDARLAVMWMRGVVGKALLEKRDFYIEIVGVRPTNRISAVFKDTGERMVHVSDSAAYYVNRSSSLRIHRMQFHFSHEYQTFSPAFEAAVSAVNPDGSLRGTDIRVIVSVYGQMRVIGPGA